MCWVGTNFTTRDEIVKKFNHFGKVHEIKVESKFEGILENKLLTGVLSLKIKPNL